MKSSLLLATAIFLASTPLCAQERSASTGHFIEYLASCLETGRDSVDQCAVDYATIRREGLIDELTSDSSDSTAYSVIKGRYNTCYLYPKDSGMSGADKGYECYSNLTGKCVSGDCCGIFGGC